MEALYHNTNRLLQEVTSYDLVKIERSHTPEEYSEAEAVVVQKLDAIHSNCNRLDILVNKEPPARRVNAKYRVDQLKYDLQHVQNSFGMLQHRRQDANRNVEELLGAGANILQGLRDQGSTLKGAHKRVLDLANTLGLSNTVMRMIERRSTQDKYILFAGMVIVLLCLYFALKYL
ncbi:Golgi SNAP receptor complex member 2 isoform X2 [Panulirus ornatus]|uniref:Golgi SNAP receptor complex member 2 isoform X2 n=1 Tax=Panulirus ornatus TaxID=150431 RepID=UPI003A8BD16C